MDYGGWLATVNKLIKIYTGHIYAELVISMGELVLAGERTRLCSHLAKLSLRTTLHRNNFT